MEISIRHSDLATRWHRNDSTSIHYLDDNGFLRGGTITKTDAERIYFTE